MNDFFVIAELQSKSVSELRMLYNKMSGALIQSHGGTLQRAFALASLENITRERNKRLADEFTKLSGPGA